MNRESRVQRTPYENAPQGEYYSELARRRALAAEKKRRKKEERRRRRKKYLAVSAVAVLCAAVIAVRLTGLWNGESGIEAERGGVQRVSDGRKRKYAGGTDR